jgi:hypothetical protein
LSDWHRLLAARPLLLLSPGVLLAVALCWAVRRWPRALTMPVFLVAVVVAFYAALAAVRVR